MRRLALILIVSFALATMAQVLPDIGRLMNQSRDNATSKDCYPAPLAYDSKKQLFVCSALKAKRLNVQLDYNSTVHTVDDFIEAGFQVVGITATVTKAITGSTGFSLGIPGCAKCWGENIASALGTSTDGSDFTVAHPSTFNVATDVTITASSDTFISGEIRLLMLYVEQP